MLNAIVYPLTKNINASNSGSCVVVNVIGPPPLWYGGLKMFPPPSQT